MNVYKLTGPAKLQRFEVPLPEREEGKVRIRVTKLLVNSLDATLFAGSVRVKYPIIPGRYAIGVVSEEGNPYYKRGTRVLLHTFRPVDTSGTQKRDFSAAELDIRGRNIDGFCRDFMVLSPDEFLELPQTVSDERALLLHHLALARAICDRLGAAKGKHVAVVGANLIGILTCQLLIYQQAAPILLDTMESHLEFARRCGIYYTMLADEHTVDEVASVTGGRLADGAVFISTAVGNEPELAFRLTARGGNTVIYGSSSNSVRLDLTPAIKKHLTVHCVNNGYDYLPTAINLMANKAVDPSPYRANVIKPAALEALLRDYPSRLDRDADEINYVDML